jgi:hypothetical protein
MTNPKSVLIRHKTRSASTESEAKSSSRVAKPSKKKNKARRAAMTRKRPSAKTVDRQRRVAKSQAADLKQAKLAAAVLGLPSDLESLLDSTKGSRQFVETVFKLHSVTRRVAASSDKAMWGVVAGAYQAFERFQTLSADGKQKALVGLKKKLADLKGPRVNAPDEARLLLHLFIDYRDERSRLNRDALALRFAHREGIEASDFYDRVSTPETGGLDRWSRAESKANRSQKSPGATVVKNRPPPAPAPSLPTAAAAGTWTVTLLEQPQRQLTRSGAFCFVADWLPEKKELRVIGATRVGARAKLDAEKIEKLLELAQTLGRTAEAGI